MLNKTTITTQLTQHMPYLDNCAINRYASFLENKIHVFDARYLTNINNRLQCLSERLEEDFDLPEDYKKHIKSLENFRTKEGRWLYPEEIVTFSEYVDNGYLIYNVDKAERFFSPYYSIPVFISKNNDYLIIDLRKNSYKSINYLLLSPERNELMFKVCSLKECKKLINYAK